jgi:hypothetical protein
MHIYFDKSFANYLLDFPSCVFMGGTNQLKIGIE